MSTILKVDITTLVKYIKVAKRGYPKMKKENVIFDKIIINVHIVCFFSNSLLQNEFE